jgi:hypothetical protein
MDRKDDKKDKFIKCTLKRPDKGLLDYGKSIRKGKSGREYRFQIGSITPVLESDFADMKKKEKYLVEVQDVN